MGHGLELGEWLKLSLSVSSSMRTLRIRKSAIWEIGHGYSVKNWEGKDIKRSTLFQGNIKTRFEPMQTFEGKDRLIQEEIQKFKQISPENKLIVYHFYLFLINNL